MRDRRTRPNPPIPESLHDVRGAAEVLNISVRSVYTLVSTGQLTPVRLLGRTLFDPADLRALIEASKRRAPAIESDNDAATGAQGGAA
jgi:hypothetical protein